MGTEAAAAMHLVLARPQAGTDHPYPCPLLTHPSLSSSARRTPIGAGNAQWLWTTQRVIPPPPPSPLHFVLARSPVGNNNKAVDLDGTAPSSWPDTPPLRRPGVVPFLWEDAPGKPKQQAGVDNGDDGGRSAGAAPPVPLRLPPRLQAAVTAELSLSRNPVLQGPCGCTGSKRPARPLGSGGSTTICRAMPNAIGGLFSWRKAFLAAPRRVGGKKGGRHHDASSCSTATSSSSALSASSSSLYFFGSDNGHGDGAERQSADGAMADSADEQSTRMSVRITKLKRHRSLPSMTM